MKGFRVVVIWTPHYNTAVILALPLTNRRCGKDVAKNRAAGRLEEAATFDHDHQTLPYAQQQERLTTWRSITLY